MPPPEPRSRTVSPALSFASAVGFPQPSEASIASAGIWPDCAASYRFEVIGSQPQLFAGAAPQHELPPVVTRSAALPYFSFTTSLMFVSVMMSPYLQIWITSRGDTALFRVQHSAYRNCRTSCSASVFAVYRRNVLSRLTRTRPSFLNLSR